MGQNGPWGDVSLMRSATLFTEAAPTKCVLDFWPAKMGFTVVSKICLKSVRTWYNLNSGKRIAVDYKQCFPAISIF